VLQQISDSNQSQRLRVCQGDFCCPAHVKMPDTAVAEVVGEELALASIPAFGTTRVDHRRLLRFAHEMLQQCEGLPQLRPGQPLSCVDPKRWPDAAACWGRE